MATRELEKGPVGARVGENLRALREARRLSAYDLAKRLREIGRPILPSGISKTESGTRRVDVDDLVALAVALDTTPNQLLFGPHADDQDLPVTARLTVRAVDAWAWAVGDEPFPLDLWGGDAVDLRRLEWARREGRPHDPPEPTLNELASLPAAQRAALATAARAIVAAVERGLSFDAIVSYAKLQARMVELARTVARRRGLDLATLSPEELDALIEQEEQEG